MGKFKAVGKFFSNLFSPPKPQLPPRVTLPPAPVVSKEESNKEADEAAKRLRLSEKRRRGRRASILSNISEKEADFGSVRRPAGRQASVLFGN